MSGAHERNVPDLQSDDSAQAAHSRSVAKAANALEIMQKRLVQAEQKAKELKKAHAAEINDLKQILHNTESQVIKLTTIVNEVQDGKHPECATADKDARQAADARVAEAEGRLAESAAECASLRHRVEEADARVAEAERICFPFASGLGSHAHLEKTFIPLISLDSTRDAFLPLDMGCVTSVGRNDSVAYLRPCDEDIYPNCGNSGDGFFDFFPSIFFKVYQLLEVSDKDTSPTDQSTSDGKMKNILHNSFVNHSYGTEYVCFPPLHEIILSLSQVLQISHSVAPYSFSFLYPPLLFVNDFCEKLGAAQSKTKELHVGVLNNFSADTAPYSSTLYSIPKIMNDCAAAVGNEIPLKSERSASSMTSMNDRSQSQLSSLSLYEKKIVQSVSERRFSMVHTSAFTVFDPEVNRLDLVCQNCVSFFAFLSLIQIARVYLNLEGFLMHSTEQFESFNVFNLTNHIMSWSVFAIFSVYFLLRILLSMQTVQYTFSALWCIHCKVLQLFEVIIFATTFLSLFGNRTARHEANIEFSDRLVDGALKSELIFLCYIYTIVRAVAAEYKHVFFIRRFGRTRVSFWVFFSFLLLKSLKMSYVFHSQGFSLTPPEIQRSDVSDCQTSLLPRFLQIRELDSRGILDQEEEVRDCKDRYDMMMSRVMDYEGMEEKIVDLSDLNPHPRSSSENNSSEVMTSSSARRLRSLWSLIHCDEM